MVKGGVLSECSFVASEFSVRHGFPKHFDFEITLSDSVVQKIDVDCSTAKIRVCFILVPVSESARPHKYFQQTFLHQVNLQNAS